MKSIFKKRDRSLPKSVRFQEEQPREPSPFLRISSSSREIGAPSRVSPPSTVERDRLHKELAKIVNDSKNATVEVNIIGVSWLPREQLPEVRRPQFDREQWQKNVKPIADWKPARRVNVWIASPPPAVRARLQAETKRREERGRLRIEVRGRVEVGRQARSLSRPKMQREMFGAKGGPEPPVPAPMQKPSLTNGIAKLYGNAMAILQPGPSFQLLENESEDDDDHPRGEIKKDAVPSLRKTGFV